MTDKVDADAETITGAPSAGTAQSSNALATLFLDDRRRLRSLWRVLLFALLFTLLLFVCSFAARAVFSIFKRTTDADLSAASFKKWWLLAQAFVFLIPSLTAGYIVGRLCERELPARALGWSRHGGWWRDLSLGSLFGAAAMLCAVLIATATGGFSFSFNPSNFLTSIVPSLFTALLIFVPAAAAEQALFTGYPFQTLLRAHPFWLPALLSALLFGYVHLGNPSVAPGFTFWNTALAGLWFAVAFWRTRSLWFVLGLHWAWNWTQGALLGIPVSGITEVVEQPLLRATETGSDFITGGAYGIEGGAACTIVIVAFTLITWRTGLVSQTPEMRSYIERERASVNASQTEQAQQVET